MKKIIFVVFLLLHSLVATADNLAAAVEHIEKEWATIYYTNSNNPSAKYAHLLAKVIKLSETYPDRAEPLLWQGIITASDADHQSPLKAIEAITQARELLTRAIALAPNGINGSAHVVLGTLYYMTPAWPLSFGDNDKARELLTTALKIAPDSIEANYFYGDFLLNQNEPTQAEIFFKKALKSPVRKNQAFADENLKHQAELALLNTSSRKIASSKDYFLSFSNTAEVH